MGAISIMILFLGYCHFQQFISSDHNRWPYIHDIILIPLIWKGGSHLICGGGGRENLV